MRTVSTTSPAAFSRWKKLLRILAGQNPNLAFPSSRTLAQVRSEPFSELWFTAAVPTNAADSSRNELVDAPFVRSEGSPAGGLPNNGSDHRPPDERTLKLGKSKDFHYLKESLIDRQQHYEHFHLFYPTFSPHNSHPKSCHRTYPSTSSPQPTHTSPLSLAKSHTTPHYGLHQ